MPELGQGLAPPLVPDLVALRVLTIWAVLEGSLHVVEVHRMAVTVLVGENLTDMADVVVVARSCLEAAVGLTKEVTG